MIIKYVGNRPVVSIMCSGRVNYVWFKDNNFEQIVDDPQHVSQILRSVQHKFETRDVNAKKQPAMEYPLTHPAIAEPNEVVDHDPVKIDPPKKTKKVKELRVSGGLK